VIVPSLTWRQQALEESRAPSFADPGQRARRAAQASPAEWHAISEALGCAIENSARPADAGTVEPRKSESAGSPVPYYGGSMQGEGKGSGWRVIVGSAVGMIVGCLGASLVRQSWQRSWPQTSRSSAKTSDAAALAVAVGAMTDEGAPPGRDDA
jgi:hypothetical protein